MPADIPVFADGPDSPDTRDSRDAHHDPLFDDVTTRAGTRHVRDPHHMVRGAYGPALELAEEAVRQAARRFAALGRAVRPDEIEMEFGVTVKGEGTVGIAKAGAEAQFRFTFRWDTAPTEALGLPQQRTGNDAEARRGDEAGNDDEQRGARESEGTPPDAAGEPGSEVTRR